MILPFSTKLNNKPTLFPEKIITGLNHAQIITWDHTEELFQTKIISKKGTCHRIEFDKSIITNPKLHTIREDKNDRWQVGTKIDFFINVRQKDMFRFAPVLPVVSIQKVYMTYKFGDVIEISIGEKYLVSYIERLEFAVNDGFDNWQDFFDYFYPKIMAAEKQFYKAKLIHWTNLKY